jgi:hypothetical protein
MMNGRTILCAFSGVVALAMACGVVWQHRNLASFRSSQESRLRQLASDDFNPAQGLTSTHGQRIPPASKQVTSDLLQLRAEVTSLARRRRELESVRVENESLRAKIAARQNSPTAAAGPASGYLRKSQARQVGYGTPEDTLQTVLWAVNNHDTNGLMEAFAPEIAQKMQQQRNANMFEGAEAVARLHILSRQELPDGTIQLKVEIDPALPPEDMKFVQIGGKWKIAEK